MRRRAFLLLPLAAALPLAPGRAQPEPRVIPIRARKFEFQPSQVDLKLGEPVVLELTTEDVLMGFNAPELGLRTDILQGRVARVPFTPQKPGTFVFACDVFCGAGHEDMNGSIRVLA